MGNGVEGKSKPSEFCPTVVAQNDSPHVRPGIELPVEAPTTARVDADKRRSHPASGTRIDPTSRADSRSAERVDPVDRHSVLRRLVLKLAVQLVPGPGRESAAESGASRNGGAPPPSSGASGARTGELGEVLEGDGGMMSSHRGNQCMSQGMKSRGDPVVLANPLTTEESLPDPTVRRLLGPEATAPSRMDLLEGSDLRESDADRVRCPLRYLNPIEGALVRVEGHQCSWFVRRWSRSFQIEDSSVRGQVELFHLDAGKAEPVSVVRGEVKEEGGPLAIAKGEADLPGGTVEVEGVRVGPEKRASHEGDGGGRAVPEPATVALGEGEGDLSGHDRVLTRELVDERPVTGKTGEGASSGLASREGLPKGLVDEKPIVGQERDQWRGKVALDREDKSAKNRGHGVRRCNARS